MIRTQIQLTEEQYRLLKSISARENISVAEVVRESIVYYTAGKCLVDQKDKYTRALKVAGRFRSGKKDISKDHDGHLNKDFKK